MRLRECSFVVVDCETTGLHPGAHHRVIELALISIDGSGHREDAWCTLINPGRDLGPTDVHRVRGRDLRGAPAFGDVLGDVLDRLAGRVVVAHNATFDCAFLNEEFERAGVETPALPALCTMRLADRIGLRAGHLALTDCCRAIGISYEATHAAMDDAGACAQLLACCMPRLEAAGLDDLAALGCPVPLPRDAWPASDQHHAPVHRSHGPVALHEPTFVGRLAREAAARSAFVTVEVAAYLDVLDRALEDRYLSAAEQEELAQVAGVLGFSADEIRRIHADYLGTLIAVAYRDGMVTDRERADLDLVSEVLGINGIDETLARLATARGTTAAECGGRSLVGLSVCFTGTLLCAHNGRLITRDDAHALAERAGLNIATRVTKKLDVLVVADPNSLSGKAQKARQYGTRIIAETAFWPMIGVEVD